MIFRFNKIYLALSILIFLIEVWIATGLREVYFVRAFLGDILVVILLYTLFFSFFETPNREVVAVTIFLFAILVEVSQYFKLADQLGFEEGSIAYIILGNYFSWEDIVCYALGCCLSWWGQKYWDKN